MRYVLPASTKRSRRHTLSGGGRCAIKNERRYMI
nr:MAG TPA: hypothetical protein [Caudoviricetes sp.]DAU83153.1 MAG TPA: hypothetical protein [Caudoviricetes sp.]DAZ59652.1 MAG TPA: hypothetical protein [Caudoviricetes sp.]